jgi:hypothetical protein
VKQAKAHGLTMDLFCHEKSMSLLAHFLAYVNTWLTRPQIFFKQSCGQGYYKLQHVWAENLFRVKPKNIFGNTKWG